MQTHKEVAAKGVLARALAGNLAEDFDPKNVDPKGAAHLILDLSRVSGVSSFGVREWVRAVRESAEKTRIWYVAASPRMTDQFNMIAGFDGGGTLLSFYGNYLCPECNNETPAMFDVQLDAASFTSDNAPVRQCRICGRHAELDDIPEALFEYAGSHPVSEVAPDVAAFLKGPQYWAEVAPGDRFAIRKLRAADATTYDIHGIIDVGFSLDSVSSELGDVVSLSLPHVQHIDPTSGTARWIEVVGKLKRDRKVRLVAVPPVFLRRVMDSSAMVAGCEISSVVYPTKCAQCQYKALLQIDPRNAFDQTTLARTKCRNCNGGPLLTRCDFSDITAMHNFVLRSRSASVGRPEHAAPREAPSERQESDLPAFLAQSSPSRYEPLCKIGEGGMSDVYLVRQHGAVGFRRLVVIKVIRSEFLTDDRLVRMFIDEARLAARLDHPNIIRVHDLGRGGGAFFMVMDFLHGRSVSEALFQTAKQNVTWPPALAATIVADLCSALARAHIPDASGKALVHRDVTPANVILRFDGLVKLIDFGLAGYQHFAKDASRAGQVVGNFAYLAPEALNEQEATPQLDIWGAGLILACLALGRHPFKRATSEETIIAILRQPPNLTGLPKELLPIVEKSLQKDPKLRYASIADMGNELREVIVEMTRDRKSSGSGSGLWRWLGRKSEDAEKPLTLESMLRRLFSHQIRIENEFSRRAGAPQFIDALLDASPKDVARLFRTLHVDDATPTASASVPPPSDVRSLGALT
ncbi:MAG: serine/threonine protein kinase [Myxococcota bacterium]